MRTQQIIEFSDQITSVKSVRGARSSTLVERLRHVLMASLFSSPGGEDAPGGLGLDFDACLARFRTELNFSENLSQTNKKLLIALDIFEENDEGASKDAWIRLFVVSLHSIARAVALFKYQSNEADDEERVETSEDEAGQADDEETSEWILQTLPGPSLLDAALPLAEWLRWNSQRRATAETQADGATQNAELSQAVRALGKAATLAAITTTSGHLKIQQLLVCARNGEPVTLDCIVSSDQISDRLAQVLRNAPHVFTLQPLRDPPGYAGPGTEQVEADPAETTRRYLVDWRISTPFLRKFASACHTPDFLAQMIEAVNAQQAVRWRINRRLMEWVRVMAWLDSSQTSPRVSPSWLGSLSEPVRSAVGNVGVWPPQEIQIGRLMVEGARGSLDPDTPVLLRQQRTKRLSQLTQEGKQSAPPVNPLDNPLIACVFEALGLDEAAVEANDLNAFHLAWFADYRGRIYADTPWFTPQGADLQRAMIEFDEGQQLSGEGRRALKRHGGGLVRRSVILKDLGIKDRNVVTFAERERWVDMHSEEVRASAQNPLSHTFWFHTSGDPLQFLAFCIEWDRQCRDPDALCHLPVQIDGSCSGLQHMAALTVSEPLGLAVNVKQRTDGLPGDIYSELAEAVRQTLASDPKAPSPGGRIDKKRKSKEATEIEALAYCFLRQRRQWISRDTAKKVVMTVPYGAGMDSQAAHVMESLIDTYCPLPETEARALEELGKKIIAGINAGKSRGTGSQAAFRPIDDDHETALWWGLRRVAFYISLELRRALEAQYPAAAKFKRTVSTIGAAILHNRGPNGSVRHSQVKLDRRMPLAWPAPSGLAVCQPGFTAKRASVSITFRGKKQISVGFTEHLPQIDANKQANSLMPNLIHSLDATHLFRTIHAITGQGVRSFGTIHDCIQCLPNDQPTVEEALRNQFFRLYAAATTGPAEAQELPQVLLDWYQWMSLLNDIVRVPQPKQLRLALGGNRGAIAQALLHTSPSELVARIERLSGVHRAIVDCLVDVLADEPIPEAEDLATAKELPTLADFVVPDEVRLDVNAVRDSAYFFA